MFFENGRDGCVRFEFQVADETDDIDALAAERALAQTRVPCDGPIDLGPVHLLVVGEDGTNVAEESALNLVPFGV